VDACDGERRSTGVGLRSVTELPRKLKVLGDNASLCHIIYSKLATVDGIPFKTVAIRGEKPSCIARYVRPL